MQLMWLEDMRCNHSPEIIRLNHAMLVMQGNYMNGHDSSVNGRTGEKIGWLGGWSGGFLWVLVMAIVRLAQGATLDGLIGISVSAAAFATIYFVAPWKMPHTPMWKLLIPLYVFLALSILWAVWTWGGFTHPDLHWWMFLWIIPSLSPLWVIGNRRWQK